MRLGLIVSQVHLLHGNLWCSRSPNERRSAERPLCLAMSGEKALMGRWFADLVWVLLKFTPCIGPRCFRPAALVMTPPTYWKTCFPPVVHVHVFLHTPSAAGGVVGDSSSASASTCSTGVGFSRVTNTFKALAAARSQSYKRVVTSYACDAACNQDQET